MTQEINLAGYGFSKLPEDIELTQDAIDIDISSNPLSQIPSQINLYW